MKTTRTMVAFLILLSCFVVRPIHPPRATAQGSGAPAAKAGDLVAQFPAGSPAQRDRLAGQLVALGEAGLADVTRQLVPGGGGRDTAARFALNAVAAYASRFGFERERAIVERACIGALDAATDVEVRTFLLSQLQLVGREPSVMAAAPLLSDAVLVEPATQLMLAVKGPAAASALRAALAGASGSGRITIVKALGELNATDAHDQVRALANDDNPAMRRAALAALARFADPRSSKTMFEAAERARFVYEPSNATAALLAYAHNLAERGDPGAAEKLCRQIMKKTNRPDRLSTRTAALAVLVDARGADALPDLLAAVDHADRAYRQAALQAAEPIGGLAAVRRWTAKAQAVSPERRAEIVAMLGRQGDPRALPFIRASLAARQPEVVLAAAGALARMEGAEAAPDLLTALSNAPAVAAGKMADILLSVIDEAHLDPLVAMFETLPPATKAAAIGVIGARGGRRFSARIMPLTADADPAIRAAAFRALAGVATPADVPALVALLDGADADAVPLVQKAIVAAVGLSVPGALRTRPLIQALPASPHPERILDLLPQVGGPEALAAVAAEFASAAEERKAAAFRALTRWTGTDAIERLLALVESGDTTYRNQAFSAFVRQVGASSLPADQKLLQFRRALELSSTVGDRRIVMRALERIRTFKSFLLVVPILDDEQLAGEAAGSLMRIALPSGADAADGLSGTIVRDALTKAMPLVTGPQRDADRERIGEYLEAMPAGDGFVPLFNGQDLSGWQGLVENPIARATLAPADLAAKQEAANAKMQANWTVRDGSIVFNGSGDNLCTVKEYGDFEMIVDWRITKGGDSGIYLRGTPQVQIWDPARTDVGAQVGSGGLYNNQKNPSAPLVRADNPVGAWNTFRITMVGDKVTVFLNGVKVAENVTLENYWDRAQPIFARGPIELQAHGTDLAFRDIYVRDLSDAAYNLTEEERTDGYVALFNGRTLDGWVGNTIGYTVEDGALVFDPKAADRSNLYTAREYEDFQFRFEFQLTPGANSGVGIRAPREGDAAYVGMEIQVLDDDAPMYATLQPYQYHGSVYGIIPAKRGFLRPVGEWNTEEILVRGSRIRVTLNGTVIVDGDLAAAAKDGTMDHRSHPGVDRAGGYIGWLSHDSVVRFRNIRIRDLSPGRR